MKTVKPFYFILFTILAFILGLWISLKYYGDIADNIILDRCEAELYQDKECILSCLKYNVNGIFDKDEIMEMSGIEFISKEASDNIIRDEIKYRTNMED